MGLLTSLPSALRHEQTATARVSSPSKWPSSSHFGSTSSLASDIGLGTSSLSASGTSALFTRLVTPPLPSQSSSPLACLPTASESDDRKTVPTILFIQSSKILQLKIACSKV